MSHVLTGSIRILSIDALKAAAKDLGAVLVENKKTFNAYYGGEQCEHAIQLPGVNYEIGLRKQKDGSFSLAWDEYSSGGRHDGNKLIEKFGAGMCKLHAAYGRQ